MLLGIAEGLTEFLPISSPGHLAVVQELLGLTDTERAKAAADAYAIEIQAGAIVAVVGIYRRRVANTLMSLVGRGHDQWVAGGWQSHSPWRSYPPRWLAWCSGTPSRSAFSARGPWWPPGSSAAW